MAHLANVQSNAKQIQRDCHDAEIKRKDIGYMDQPSLHFRINFQQLGEREHLVGTQQQEQLRQYEEHHKTALAAHNTNLLIPWGNNYRDLLL